MIKTLFKKVDANRNPKISIVIPTYNRIENLKILLKKISNEKNLNEVEVLVLDNLSTNLLNKKFINELSPIINFTYLQNKYHLGPDVNYLRAIEFGSAKWVFPIGDSKIPFEGFIKRMLNDIKVYKNSRTIIYKFASKIESNLIITSINEIKTNKIHFGDFFLGGTSIISKKAIQENLSQSGQITLTRMPHALFHLNSIISNKEIVIISQKIIETFLSKPSYYDPQRSFFECWAQFPLIDVITNNNRQRAILHRKIFQVYGEIWRFGYHSLKFLFVKKIDISANIHRIIKYRYIHFSHYWDLPIIYSIYILSLILKTFRYVK